MFERWVEGGLMDLLDVEGVGCIPFSPLAQGMLTDRYLHGVPEDSRAARSTGFLQTSAITEKRLDEIKKLNSLALKRGQTLAQMALSWILKDPRVTSVLIGASKPEQLADSLKCLDNVEFSTEELAHIEDIFK
jgi:L-glyceraldehyde 3-phosphate reductase